MNTDSQVVSNHDSLIWWYVLERIPVTASVVGEGNSGKIVTEMRNVTQEFDKEHDKQSAIIDGDSSIGCPVIAIVRGVWGD
jgi:MinD superfamily P-loop ATPase